uniref:helix-turn-helix transcriptional regulator n=1 Tax=Enterocloster clostridioformis TaxID=1531 RepID=UPI0026F31F4F|nr:AraC family transcriptional regulator [Enterocloster clostridioformis]
MHYLDYNENKQHGTLDFPIEYYHVNEHHPRYNMPFHWHKELEIIRIQEGVLFLKLDDEEIEAKSGDIIFVNEGVIHGGMPQNCIYECIVFDIQRLLMHTDTCKYYIRQLTKHHLMVQNHFTRENQSLYRIIDHLFTSMQHDEPGSELITMGTLFETFGIIYQKKLYQDAVEDKKSSIKMMQLKPVLEYIDINYSQAISLDDLSRIAGMSPKYFCRYFHSVIHTTPIDYLNYYRIERACYELSATDLTVSEVAYRCGFADVCYFIKMFKKYKGITPRHYRMNFG